MFILLFKFLAAVIMDLLGDRLRFLMSNCKNSLFPLKEYIYGTLENTSQSSRNARNTVWGYC
jgi:hypothetical protein